MELTKEQLMSLREQALVKRQGLLDMVHQADGALGVLNLLLEQLSRPQMEKTDAPNSDSND
jgi:hypothetical protein